MTSPRFTASLLFCLALAAAEPQMVFVPGGEFLRGRTHALPDDGLKWWPELLTDDRPVRKVSLSPFYIAAREVTNADFAKYVEARKARPPYNWPRGRMPEAKAKLPVAAIDWNEAAAYCRWAGGRLPTEAEWERAYRGLAEGTEYYWGKRGPTKKDACYDTMAGPCEVGGFPPNPFGLYDMAGNVWEWTSDWYAREYYKDAPAADPAGPATGQYKVIRGGSWADVPKYLTSAHRDWARPLERSPNIGFRCAKSFGGRPR